MIIIILKISLQINIKFAVLLNISRQVSIEAEKIQHVFLANLYTYSPIHFETINVFYQ